jgi:hypothetical protein
MYQGVSPWVDARQWLRTYSRQRPGRTSGAYNRSPCRSVPVLSHYPGGGLALFVPAARAGAVGSARTIPSRLLLRRWPSARRCRWDGRPTQSRGGSSGVAPQGSRCPRSGTGSGRPGQCTCHGPVMDPSCSRRIPASATCLDHQAAKSVIPGGGRAVETYATTRSRQLQKRSCAPSGKNEPISCGQVRGDPCAPLRIIERAA